MKKLFFILSAMLACGFSCNNGQKGKLIDDFSITYNFSAKYNEINQTLVVDIHLDPGIHAYGDGEKIGKPVNIKVLPENGWQALGEPIIPKSQKVTLGASESMVLKGDFSLLQKIKKGDGPGEGQLFLQVCSENQCDRPLVHKITW